MRHMEVRHAGLLATLIRSKWLVFRLHALVVAKELGWCSSALMPFSRVHPLLLPKQRCDRASTAVMLCRLHKTVAVNVPSQLLCLESYLTPSDQLLTK